MWRCGQDREVRQPARIVDLEQCQNSECDMRKNLPLISLFAFLVAVTFCLVGCTSSPTREKIKVGAILPLTESAAILGNGVKEGMEIAVDNVNTTGGIKGQQLKVIFQNSQNDATKGLSALQMLLDVEKVPAVVVAMSSVTSAAIPVADKRQVVLFGTVTATPGLTKQSEWVFRNYYTTDAQGAVMARYLIDTEIKKIAVIYINDDYGVTGTDAFRKSYAEMGGQVLAGEGYDKASTDMRAQITKAMADNPAAILLISYGSSLGNLVKQVRELGYQGKVLSYTGLVDPDVLKQAGTAADGANVVTSTYNPDKPVGTIEKRFVEAYQKRFGKLPSHYAAFGYDTLMMIVASMRESGTSSEQIRKGLGSIGKTELAMGEISIEPDREVHFLQVMKVIHKGALFNEPSERN